MNIEIIRSLFPHLQTNQIYFNHAAIGPWNKLILDRLEEYKNLRTGIMINPHQYFVAKSKSAKDKLAKLIGGTSDRIAWIDNVSNGINLLVHSINWQNGDEVIINDIEFPANVYPFLNLKRKGVEIKFAKSKNGIVDVEEIEQLITEKTKLISISYVQFLSGYHAKIHEIGELCRSHGIIFCVDAIQATGAISIDVVKSNIDFLVGGTQKWLMTSQGLSYLYINKELQDKIQQENVGWTSVKNEDNFLSYTLELKESADRYQNGTLNSFGVCLLDASLDLFLEVGISEIEKRIKRNSVYLMNRLYEIGISPILLNTNEDRISGIVSFYHNNNQAIFNYLKSKNIICAMREGYIRLSPHFYNIKIEIDFVVEEIKKCLMDLK